MIPLPHRPATQGYQCVESTALQYTITSMHLLLLPVNRCNNLLNLTQQMHYVTDGGTEKKRQRHKKQ